ncbi:MAG: RmlD substrate-binding protein [Gammaproteobacteria bacterium]|nr:MAG: RmlD substrate-binding protein [Gammaproteobacteria bacterium]
MQNNEIKNQLLSSTSSSSNKTLLIALTGATGFIGSTLLTKLTDNGWHVRSLYRHKKGRTPKKSAGVEWLAGELNDENTLDTLVNDVDVVIHCAGAVRGINQTDFDQVNEAGALQIAKAVSRQARVPKFLLLSSLAAREPQLSFYAGSKWRGEQAIKSALKDFNWTIIRPPAVFGPGDKELLPLFQSIAKGFAPIPAGKNRRFSMIYVDDVASAIIHCISNDIGCGKTYEIDDGQPNGYDWDKVLTISAKVLRNGAAVRKIPVPITLLNLFALINFNLAKLLGYAPMLTPGKINEITHTNWVCNHKEFDQMNGWQPTFGLETGLAEIFNANSAKFKVG